MDTRSRTVGRRAGLALAALLGARCHEHDVQLVLALRGLAPAPSDVVDVYVVGACPAPGLVGGEPANVLRRESFAYDTTPVPLGDVQVGHAGVYARVRGGACVRAAGCTDVAMLGATSVVEVALSACVGAACPGAPSTAACSGGPDAGVHDAGATCPDGAAPTPEVCDDVDNDCDGLIDENLTMGCQIDACTPGVQTCAGGRWTVCVATTTPACATAPVGGCGPTLAMDSMVADGVYTFSGTTCGAADHYALANDPPCTPDQVYEIAFDEALGSNPAVVIASDMPVAAFDACSSAAPTTCGTAFSQRAAGVVNSSLTLVLESPDGGCGPYHFSLDTRR